MAEVIVGAIKDGHSSDKVYGKWDHVANEREDNTYHEMRVNVLDLLPEEFRTSVKYIVYYWCI